MKRRTIVIACVAGLIGLAVGAAPMLWYLSGPMQRMELARLQVNAAMNITALEELHAGRLNEARQFLEGQVDAAVIGLHFRGREDKKLSSEALSTLQAIATYRSGITYAPSAMAQKAGVPQILDSAMKGHLTDRSIMDAPESARR